MKKHSFFYLTAILFLWSCSKGPGPEDYDFLVIPNDFEMSINGMNEHNGQLSIFGDNPRFGQELIYFDGTTPPGCLYIKDQDEEKFIPIDIPIYATRQPDGSWEEKNTFKTNILDAYFVNSDLGFVQTELEGMFKTTDGGNSWTQILKGGITYHCVSRRALRMDQVRFRDANVGYALDTRDDFVLKTEDGGENWEVFLSGYTDIVTSVWDIYTVPESEVVYWQYGAYSGYR